MHALVHFFCDLVRGIAIFLSLSLSHFVCLPSRIITTTAALAGGVRVCVGVYVGIRMCMCMCVYVCVSFEGTCANMANCGNDCHRHSPQISESVYVCVCCCAALCRLQLFLLSLLPNCLPPLPAPSLSTLVSSTCPFPRVTLNKRFLLAAPCCCHAP